MATQTVWIIRTFGGVFPLQVAVSQGITPLALQELTFRDGVALLSFRDGGTALMSRDGVAEITSRDGVAQLSTRDGTLGLTTRGN